MRPFLFFQANFTTYDETMSRLHGHHGAVSWRRADKHGALWHADMDGTLTLNGLIDFADMKYVYRNPSLL